MTFSCMLPTNSVKVKDFRANIKYCKFTVVASPGNEVTTVETSSDISIINTSEFKCCKIGTRQGSYCACVKIVRSKGKTFTWCDGRTAPVRISRMHRCLVSFNGAPCSRCPRVRILSVWGCSWRPDAGSE